MTSAALKLGFLSCQESFTAMLIQALTACRVCFSRLEEAKQLEEMDGLIMAGSDPLLLLQFMTDRGLTAPVRDRALKGMPLFGLGAGLVLMATGTPSPWQGGLALMDLEISREASAVGLKTIRVELSIPALGEKPVAGDLIEKPLIKSVQPQVGIMAVYGETVVMARQGSFLASSFYPRVDQDLRVYDYFLRMVKETWE
ncbi:MAG: pyridoxal 5'-phosphate synthase glutaminase subunit PdxT [Bacillota bacterium]